MPVPAKGSSLTAATFYGPHVRPLANLSPLVQLNRQLGVYGTYSDVRTPHWLVVWTLFPS